MSSERVISESSVFPLGPVKRLGGGHRRSLVTLLFFVMLVFSACKGEKKEMPSVMFGQGGDVTELDDYDLADIQVAGELIAVTLSGPDTYYEYRGQGFGLQFSIAEAYARSIGARLRMEIANDTAELLRKLSVGEADMIAYPLPADSLTDDNSRHKFVSIHKEWLVRSSSPALAESAEAWWTDDTRAHFQALEQMRTRPRKTSTRPSRPPMLSRQKGVISNYDALFIRHSAIVGWDWRLIAAQCYQESAFEPRAISWAGAQGLMQIMPGTASRLGLTRSDVFDPERNIEAACRYLRHLSEVFSDIPNRSERINFVLASYNGGTGHVRDAMALARKNGRNPQRWADVDPFILRLSQPQYYRDPVVKFGYLRGSETSGYVRQIQSRWASYRGSAPAHHSSLAPSKGSSSKGKSSSSRIRSREEFMTDSAFWGK